MDDLEEEKSTIQSKYSNAISVLSTFWSENINTLSDDEYCGLALNFYSNVFNAIPEARELFTSVKKDMTTQSKIFFGMFGMFLLSEILNI